MDESGDAEQAMVRLAQARVEGILLSHAPECASVIEEIHEYWRDREPIGMYQLLMEFGNRYLLAELAETGRVSDTVRRVYAAVEELLSDDDEAVAEAAYFGTIEPLGLLVDRARPEDVGPRVGREIAKTYPAWASTARGQ